MTPRPHTLFDRVLPPSDWAMTSRMRRFGFALILVWLALLGSFTSPLIAARHMLAMASLDASAICLAENGDAPAVQHPAGLPGDPSGMPGDMADCCIFCLPDAPVLAQLDAPSVAHTPRLIGRAWANLMPQPQAPAGAVAAAAYPRGPPTSI